MCHKFRPSFLCLAEPMVEFDKVPVAFWRFLGFELLVANDRGNNAPNLWMLASSEAMGWATKIVAIAS